MNEEVTAGYFPAMDGMPNGKTFKPSKALRNKYWFTAISTAIGVWILVVAGFYGISYLISLDEAWSHAALMGQWLGFVNYWTFIANMAWLIPALIGIKVYINSIEYSVISESGEASPEIYVRKGIINVTKKHVPFRTITNISSRAGVIDRLFGIGNVEIQTAGYSGGPTGQAGPEEKLEGIVAFEELTHFVLGELRKFRDPYTTGTEVVFPRDETVPRLDSSLDDEILSAIRDIREILRTKM
ncbi:MAG: PH domain-containing protein [Candidatus Thorarchaeota archaeon]